jgi:hypothetical protein
MVPLAASAVASVARSAQTARGLWWSAHAEPLRASDEVGLTSSRR